jgi:enoyl-CoA hydratase
MTGREVKPDEALRIGLVDRVVPVEGVVDAGRALARELAGKAPLAVRAIKHLIDAAAAGQGPEASLQAVAEAQVKLIAHPDFMEAVSARMQKREPVFSAK